MKLKIYNLCFLLISLSCLCTAQASNDVNTSISNIFDHGDFEYASYSLSAIDVASSKTIAAERAKKVLVPASSQKLLFSLIALDQLGEDYEFMTNLSYDGEIEFDGTLKGNIYVEGSGDPSLGSPKEKGVLNFEDFLSDVVERIKQEGITCIDGDIIVDESIINTSPVSPSWQWNDLGNYYASGAWGVNIHENLYYIKFSNRATVGRRPKIISMYPRVNGLEVSNEVIVDEAHTGDQAYIFGGPYNFYKRIIGTIPAGEGSFTIKGSIPDPPRFLAYHIQKALERAKIKSGETRTIYTVSKNKASRISIAKYFSPPLSAIVKRCNKESNNLYAEALSKAIGLKKYGRASGSNGIRTVRSFMDEKGIDSGGLNLEDGSGLSARNYISSNTLAEFLAAISRKLGRQKIVKYLNQPGIGGDMSYMFNGSPIRGNVWLKSGSMSKVLSYTGFIESKSGNWISFSLIVNGFTVSSSKMRKHLEKIMETIYLEG